MERNQLQTELKLSRVLRDLLTQRGMTASQLSRHASVPKSVLSDWLAGTNPRSIPQLMRVARILGVSLEILCFGHDQNGSLTEGQRIKGLIAGEFMIIRRL